jgi:hypothetical protein
MKIVALVIRFLKTYVQRLFILNFSVDTRANPNSLRQRHLTPPKALRGPPMAHRKVENLSFADVNSPSGRGT